MKLLSLLFIISILPFIESFRPQQLAEGTYVYQHAQSEDWLLIQDQYFVETSFNKESRRFNYTRGGVVKAGSAGLDCRWEFDTKDAAMVSKVSKQHYTFSSDGIIQDGRNFKRVNEPATPLTGYYRITGRKNGGSMNSMPLAARKTIKLLTGSRFQWAAINTSTGEFFGAGGGRYTFNGNEYTEHIDFFSRDSSRVGASLTFTDTLNGKSWIHTGLSSKGDPIYEIWTREKISY